MKKTVLFTITLLLSLAFTTKFDAKVLNPILTAESQTSWFARLEWQTGMYGTGIGFPDILHYQSPSDGLSKIILTSENKFWYVVNHDPAGGYKQIWRSEYYYPAGISEIVVYDINGDQVPEILVALNDGQLRIYHGETFQLIQKLTAPGPILAFDIKDIDKDQTLEIAFSISEIILELPDIYIYSLSPFSFELLIPDRGGHDLLIGNVDTDPAFEIVSDRGYVVDANSRVTELSVGEYGFGKNISLVDIDDDGMQEIIGVLSYELRAYDADLKIPKWFINTMTYSVSYLVDDIDHDSTQEIILGGQSTICYNSKTTQVEWERFGGETPNNMAHGDFDGDGIIEFVIAYGNSSAADYVRIYDGTTWAIEWSNPDLFGPFFVDTGDIDNDGQIEIVTASWSAEESRHDGIIQVFDAETHQLEWQSTQTQRGIHIDFLRVADVDDDDHLEIIISVNDSSYGQFLTYDGLTHELDDSSPPLNGYFFPVFEIDDIDLDGQPEIVASKGHFYSDAQYVSIYNGVTLAEEWAITLPGSYKKTYDIELSDIDMDGHLEIIIAYPNLFVYDGVTRKKELEYSTLSYGLDVADLNGDGIPSLLVGLENGDIMVLHGQTKLVEAMYDFGVGPVYGIQVDDIDIRNDLEIIVFGPDQIKIFRFSDNSLQWVKDLGGFTQIFSYGIRVADIDVDKNREILVGSYAGIDQFEVAAFNPLKASSKFSSRSIGHSGETITFTIKLRQNGWKQIQDVSVVDTIPEPISYVSGSISSSSGTATYVDGKILWNGSLAVSEIVTLTYQTVVKEGATFGAYSNNAVVSSPITDPIELRAPFVVSINETYLPVIRR